MGRYTTEQSHRIMSAVKSKNTKPEMTLRKALWRRNFRYRTNYKGLTGKPDIVLTRVRIAIFCDGDFWHGHNWALRGLTSLEDELDAYSDYWKKKILRNIERDQNVTQELSSNGWLVLRFWESEIKTDIDNCVDRIQSAYDERIKTQH